MAGGKRPGALCSYLELWHADIEDFLDLRKETGDDRRRTHNMNTAHWIPDLFMKRLKAISEGELSKDATWTLFRTNEVRDLPELYGRAFEKRYECYESLAAEGKLWSRKVRVLAMWKRMLEMLFETGHPWITWKDPANVRNPQDHCGIIHSSNLCTEIELNTSSDEVAVCAECYRDNRTFRRQLRDFLARGNLKHARGVVTEGLFQIAVGNDRNIIASCGDEAAVGAERRYVGDTARGKEFSRLGYFEHSCGLIQACGGHEAVVRAERKRVHEVRSRAHLRSHLPLGHRSEPAGHGGHPALGGVVHDGPAEASGPPALRREVDDATATPLRPHDLGGRAVEEECGLEVEVDLVVPVVLGDVVDVVAAAQHSGEVGQYVETAEL